MAETRLRQAGGGLHESSRVLVCRLYGRLYKYQHHLEVKSRLAFPKVL